MADTWTGGVVASMNDDEPPTVRTWQDVSVPGVANGVGDATDTIAYRRSFPDPRQTADEYADLELTGVCGRAHVWVNDSYLGEHEGSIERAIFPFEPESTNELVVVCEPSRSTAAIVDRAGPSNEAAVPGIRGGVAVHRRSEPVLRDLQITPRLSDERASLDVTVTVDAVDRVDDVLTFSLRPNGFRGGGSMDRTPIDAPADGRIEVETTIHVRNPSLWWPRELGPQNRYTLRAKLGDRSIERTVGLRTIGRDEAGLRVNGHRVPARGFTIRPGESIRSAIDAAVEANATMVRFPGHVPSRAVYDACDETGLLIWQDLPVPAEFEVDRATETATRLLDRRVVHPSLVAIGIQDTGHEPFVDSLGSGLLSKLRVRWRTWRASTDRSPAEAVASRLDDSVVAIPVVGAPGTDADVVRLAPSWRYLDVDDTEWLLDRYLDDAAAGASVCALADAAPTNGSVTELQTDELSTESVLSEPAATDGGTTVGADEQTTTLKTVTEALRRRRCGIVLVETLLDDGNGLGVCTVDGSPRPAFDAVAASYAPIQAVVEGRPHAGTTETVWVLNETAKDVQGSVNWRTDGEEGSMTIAVDSYDADVAGDISLPSEATELTLTVETDAGRVANDYRI